MENLRQKKYVSLYDMIDEGVAKGEARGEARGEVRGEVRGIKKGKIQTLTYLITLPPDEMRKQALEMIAKLEAENQNLENDQDLESDNDLEL